MTNYVKQVLAFRQIRALTRESVEVSAALYMDDKGKVYMSRRGYSKRGTPRGVEFPDYLEVINNCKKLRVSKVILVHNHPPVNGVIDTRPSHDDIRSTANFAQKIKEAGLTLVDHIIVSRDGFYSFKMQNLL